MIGYIYIMSNPAMPDLYKIGMTIKGGMERAETLSNTSVPYAFKCVYEQRTITPKALESHIHAALCSSRVSDNREFFSFESEGECICAVRAAAESYVKSEFDQDEPNSKKVAPYQPYVGQQEDMREVLGKSGTTYAQQHRDAMKAYLKKELKK